jgi:hypothetical protein
MRSQALPWLLCAGVLSCAAPAAAQSASAPLVVTAEVVPTCVINAGADADTAARVSVYCGPASRMRVRRGARGPLESPVVEKGPQATARFSFPIDAARPAMRREQAPTVRPSDVLIVLEF